MEYVWYNVYKRIQRIDELLNMYIMKCIGEKHGIKLLGKHLPIVRPFISNTPRRHLSLEDSIYLGFPKNLNNQQSNSSSTNLCV
jgi:hypothetical protein